MRTLRITLLSSLAGWATGFVAGNVGGVLLAALMYGLRESWNAQKLPILAASEMWWAFVLASGMLPGSALLVAPQVYWQLGKTERWSPLRATLVGGAGGVLVFGLWLAVLALFTQPVNWSRRDDCIATATFTVVSFLVGAMTGSVAARLARAYPAGDVPPAVPGAAGAPPAPSYDY